MVELFYKAFASLVSFILYLMVLTFVVCYTLLIKHQSEYQAKPRLYYIMRVVVVIFAP